MKYIIYVHGANSHVYYPLSMSMSLSESMTAGGMGPLTCNDLQTHDHRFTAKIYVKRCATVLCQQAL